MKYSRKASRRTLVIVTLVGIAVVIVVCCWQFAGVILPAKTIKSCKDNNGVEMCVKLARNKMKSNDTNAAIVSVKNNRSETITGVEVSDCSDPVLMVNDDVSTDSLSACAANLGFSTIQLDPGDSKQFGLTLDGALLRPGSNTVQAAWNAYTSGDMTVYRR